MFIVSSKFSYFDKTPEENNHVRDIPRQNQKTLKAAMANSQQSSPQQQQQSTTVTTQVQMTATTTTQLISTPVKLNKKKRTRYEMENDKPSTPITKKSSTIPSSPPAITTFKRVKRCLGYPPHSHRVNLFVTKDYSCNITLHTVSTDTVPEVLQNLSELKVADFAPDTCLYLYKKDNEMALQTIQLELKGETESDRIMLAYLKGLLNRKDEVAVVPIPDTDRQLLIFEYAEESNVFNATLRAVLVRRYNLVLDLDETLIRTRQPKSDDDKPFGVAADEHEFNVEGNRFICCVRPGTNLLLQWGAQIFNIVIVTNSILPYAIQICKILDPRREHLLKGIDMDNAEQLHTMLRTRTDMAKHPQIPPPLGQKDLVKLGLSPFESVVLDDDENIWKLKEPLLPFAQIVQNTDAKGFFCAVRTETWKKLSQMILLKYRLKEKIEREKTMGQSDAPSEPLSKRPKTQQPTFSQEFCLSILEVGQQ
jgi:hypothetical protein